MSAATTRWYLSENALSGGVADFSLTAPGSSGNTAVSFPFAGSGSRKFIPGQTSSTAASPPGAPATFVAGWKLPTAINVGADANNQWQFTTLTWPVSILITGPLFGFTLTALLFLDSTEVSRQSVQVVLPLGSDVVNFNNLSVPGTLWSTAKQVRLELYLSPTLALVNGGTYNLAMGSSSYVDVGSWALRATRSSPDTVPTVGHAPSRVLSVSRRPTEVVTAASDVASRRVDFVRRPIDTTPVPVDAASRSVTFRPVAQDTVPAVSHAASRQVIFRRDPVPGLSVFGHVASRSVSTTRVATDVVVADGIPSRLVTFGRAAREQMVPGDEPLIDPTKKICGVVRDSSGNPYLDGATVVLFKAGTNTPVASVTSSLVDGSYEFARNSYDASLYYVAAWGAEGTATPIQAVTERDLLPA